MRMEWQVGPLGQWDGDGVLFLGFEKEEPLAGFGRWLEAEGDWLRETGALEDFKGSFQQTAVFYAPADKKTSRVICVGLGKRKDFDGDRLRGALAAGLRRCRELRLHKPLLPLAALEGIPMEATSALEEAVVGGWLGLYRYDAPRGRDDERPPQLEQWGIHRETEPEAGMREAVDRALAVASGVFLARTVTTAPANEVTPRFLAEKARETAERHGFRLQAMDEETAAEMGMGAFLAVAQGSREPGCFVVMEHAPAGTEEDAPLVFVGKGITFDTGGISIKPADKMELMKHDMAGAAAVLGAMDALGALDVPKRVVGILPCAENMPGGNAYKPGDVVRSLSGLTIEVISTDAEGRMVLCDGLAYARRYKPAFLVDVATLTGACIVALGDRVGGVMGNREDLVEEVRRIGMEVGDKLWPLPLWDFYFEDLKSDVADFKNVGTRKAGCVIGGMFLKQFVDDETPWVHLDIAGPAWADKDQPTAVRGATGFGVRTLVEIARRWPAGGGG